MDVEEAYEIQRRQLRLLESDPERAIKLGLTTAAQRREADYPGPSMGSLTESMILRPGEPFSMARGISPRLEPEIVVILGRELTRVPDSREQLCAAIASVHAGIEIVDPRYDGGGFILTDALADNSSALAGTWSENGYGVDECDLANERVGLEIDGALVAEGSGAEVMGDPLQVVHEAIAERIRRDYPVFPGLAIFTGNTAPPAARVHPGARVIARFSTLGEVRLDVVD